MSVDQFFLKTVFLICWLVSIWNSRLDWNALIPELKVIKESDIADLKNPDYQTLYEMQHWAEMG